MNNLTSNTNLLSQSGFKLILNSNEFANTEFFAITASIPSVSMNAVPTSFRNKAGFVPGEKLNYDPLNLRIAVDENLVVYEEIYNWMKSHSTQTDLKMADMTLIVQTSHRNANKAFRFVNAFPTNIGQIEFSAAATDVEYAIIDVTFQYDYFIVTDINDDLNCG